MNPPREAPAVAVIAVCIVLALLFTPTAAAVALIAAAVMAVTVITALILCAVRIITSDRAAHSHFAAKQPKRTFLGPYRPIRRNRRTIR
ncbi:hypothetical protein [Planomonospora sp. ID82291]|uniref:hypothetical protein n=1 Tax=Planomonospora sp. ID82291 TaxID=2738136 RepID=UPI0018C422A7|nr:hypothetical protein [Planomonospora sp. ID82291]MBG0818731.1 hypothetical protein [Planomonospora sp. ID82291]